MKYLNKFKDMFNSKSFDLEHETDMVQSRIVSTILEVKEKTGMTQKKLSELTGLKQPFISALFNNRKRLNMEHIALFQNAMEFKLQPPKYLSSKEHFNKFYSTEGFDLERKYWTLLEEQDKKVDVVAVYMDTIQRKTENKFHVVKGSFKAGEFRSVKVSKKKEITRDEFSSADIY